MKRKLILIISTLILSLGIGLLIVFNNNVLKPNKENFKIILSEVSNGSISSSAIEVEKGGSVEITIHPHDNYQLDYLKTNGVELLVENDKTTIINITEDQVVTANFIGIDVEVSFYVNSSVLETKTIKFGESYDVLPDATPEVGYEFMGWFTEENGAGLLVTEDTLVENGSAHSLYAFFVPTTLTVNVKGLEERLVRLPGNTNGVTTLNFSVFEAGINVTQKVNITLESSDSSLLIVDGHTLSVASKAEGIAELKVFVDGVKHKTISIYVIDYDGLGYKAISSKADLLAINGNSKYVLTSDIKLDGWISKSNGVPMIAKLESGAVIDGNGHIISGAKLHGGMGNGWIGEVYGIVRNIAFTNLINASENAYNTGLFGTLKTGGLLENILVDTTIVCDSTDINTSGGVLVGILDGGTIKNVVLNINKSSNISLKSYGAFAGMVKDSNALVYNSYAIVHNTNLKAIGNEYKVGLWDSVVKDDSYCFKSVNEFLNYSNKNDLFDNFLWNAGGYVLSFAGQDILYAEEEYTGKIEEVYSFMKTDKTGVIEFEVYRYGNLITNYTVTEYHSSDEEVFTVDENGVLTIVDCGEAILTIVVNEELVLVTTIYVKKEFYLITTPGELMYYLSKDSTGNFKLANNLDFDGSYISGASDSCVIKEFAGVFDGDGYAILNAKLPGSWNGNGMIGTLTGTFKNVAFINLIGASLCTDTAIIARNKGLIENVYVDFVINSNSIEYGIAGVVAGYSDTGIIRNCVTNIRLEEGLDVAPKYYGSIIGNANSWSGKVSNCYAIVHKTGVVDIAAKEGAKGIIDQFKNNGTAQFETYSQLIQFADVSMYDKTMWSFDTDKIILGHNIVYKLQKDDGYTYITDTASFKREIEANPSGKFRLNCDIDFAGESINFSEDIDFTGELDGNGFIISNAKMTKNNIFTKNEGKIFNLAFVNLHGPVNGKQAGIVKVNVGIIDNVFVDYIIYSDGSLYEYAGVVAADGSTGTISSTIINISLAEGVTSVPTFYGSIVGKVTSNTIIINTYSIINGLNISNIAKVEEGGSINQITNGTCKQVLNYSDIRRSGEDYHTFNSDIWSFYVGKIKFRNTVVVEDLTQDEYIHIKTVDDWLTLIPTEPAGKFKLDNDIDFKGGYLTGDDNAFLLKIFTGELDGQGYQIKNAVLPGGWAGHSLFENNDGLIKNIAFINIKTSSIYTAAGIVTNNRGIIENIYLDIVLTNCEYDFDYNGTLCAFPTNPESGKESIIKNCIVNVRMEKGAQLSANQGSIIGSAGGWNGFVKNCYAIVNGTGIKAINATEAAAGVANYAISSSEQFTTYDLLIAGANLSVYDKEIWTFGKDSLLFFGKVVLGEGAPIITDELVQPDGYIYISTVKEFLTLIAANPNSKFRLANDLDFEGGYISGKSPGCLVDKFTGELDGQGYQIKNAVLPGGWAGHALFGENEGVVKNIAFINIKTNAVYTNAGLIGVNAGIIENIYLDIELTACNYESNHNGTLCAFPTNPPSGKESIIRNCIINVRLADGATLPPNQGSIVGRTGGWTGYVKNCYAITNNTGISNIYVDEAAAGVAQYVASTSRQFSTYADLEANANISMYDKNIWTFNTTTISFFGRVVYSVS